MQRFRLAALAALTLTACDGRTLTDAAVAVPNGAAAQRAAVALAAPTVIVSGLEYPRGFTFGRDGAIYVAEAGTPLGNTFSTIGQCQQVPSPVGPSKGGHTGRISRVTMAGVRTTVVDGLPSSRNGTGAVSGVADVAFVDRDGSKANDDEADDAADGGGTAAQGASMYALVLGGCSHGLPGDPSSVIRVGLNGTYTITADLSRWIKANPAKNPEPDDFEPDGDWYNLAARGNLLYAVESNQGNLVSIKPENGQVRRVADVSATENGHVVPTGLSVSQSDDDALYVGELTPFPSVPGAANVIEYEHNGQVQRRVPGFSAIVGVANDRIGNLYVLETFKCPAGPCFPNPGTGRVVRISRNGARDIVATGLIFPTGLRLGPDGALYVSNHSYGPPHLGQILRIPL